MASSGASFVGEIERWEKCCDQTVRFGGTGSAGPRREAARVFGYVRCAAASCRMLGQGWIYSILIGCKYTEFKN